VILRRMNRTARLYAGVKKSFYLRDGTENGQPWDEGLVGEGEEEENMTESQELKRREIRNSELGTHPGLMIVIISFWAS
jgi:hypothetical protein